MKPKNPNAAVHNIPFTGWRGNRKPVLRGLTQDITDMVHACPNVRYYVDAYDY